MNRRYFRCVDCLNVFAIDYERDMEWRAVVETPCPCGGHIEDLGMVRGDRLKKSWETTACDDRCTSAVGPVCSCSCGGKNHGSHKTVKVTVDCGGVPHLNFQNFDHTAKAETFRVLFKKAKDAWTAKYGEITSRKDRGWLPRPEWDFYYEGIQMNRKLWKIRNMKTFNVRQKRLQEFLNELGAAA